MSLQLSSWVNRRGLAAFFSSRCRTHKISGRGTKNHIFVALAPWQIVRVFGNALPEKEKNSNQFYVNSIENGQKNGQKMDKNGSKMDQKWPKKILINFPPVKIQFTFIGLTMRGFFKGISQMTFYLSLPSLDQFLVYLFSIKKTCKKAWKNVSWQKMTKMT